MLGLEQLEDGLQQRAPQRQQVMALVEHDDADAGLAQAGDALARGGRQQIARGDVRQPARGDAALQPRDDPRDVAVAAIGGRAVPRRGLGDDLAQRLAGCLGALARPHPRRRLAQHALRIARLTQRLIGQRVQVGARRAEQRLLLAPLALDRARRAQHHGRHADAPHDLQPDDRLARARRRDQQRPVASRGAVGLEGLQAAVLIAAPAPLKRPRGERRGHDPATNAGRPRAARGRRSARPPARSRRRS